MRVEKIGHWLFYGFLLVLLCGAVGLVILAGFEGRMKYMLDRIKTLERNKPLPVRISLEGWPPIVVHTATPTVTVHVTPSTPINLAPRIAPQPVTVSRSGGAERSIHSTNATATALPMRSTVPWPPRMPKAPPGFFMYVRLRRSGIRTTLSPTRIVRSTISFRPWSTAKTARASAKASSSPLDRLTGIAAR